jgi:RNA polymerase sigma factor (sigma-70 family)
MDEAANDIAPELLAAVRQGDEAASRRLIKLLYPSMIAIIRNHLPRNESEEDMAQEVFLKVFARLGQFRGEKPLAHWASRIALHTCYDALRRQQTRPVIHFSELDAADAESIARCSLGSQDDHGPAHGEAARELLDKLLATLKPDQQLAIRLLDLEQRSVKEVAELTGWSASKVKVSALRARRRLASILGKWENGTRNHLDSTDD